MGAYAQHMHKHIDEQQLFVFPYCYCVSLSLSSNLQFPLSPFCSLLFSFFKHPLQTPI